MRADSKRLRGRKPGKLAHARERGSALLISLMVMVIMTLLGMAYMLMAETEGQIAINERNASQALYVAESATRAVVDWFDNPVSGFSLPAAADVDLTLRMLDLDDDGVWETAADGSAGQERYKQTSTEIFQKPYRGSIQDAFLGTETNPDVRITPGAFLDTLNTRLLGTGAGTLADPEPLGAFGEITQIDLYAPPIYEIGGARMRYGVVTIKVTAQKIRNIAGTDRVLAQRSVKAVVNEINYPSADGPLQSCTGTGWNGDFRVRWGTTATANDATFFINSDAGMNNRLLTGMPYATGSPVQYFSTAGDFNTWYAAANGVAVDDPWHKLMIGGAVPDFADPAVTICSAPTAAQPCPDPVPPAGSWNGTTDHTNVFQGQGVQAGCPDFDYSLFKTVAQRGGEGIYYYSWNGTNFQEGGTGTPVSHKVASDNKSGFFFFDTATGTPPEYDVGNECTNCTPTISYAAASSWGTGPDTFMYLNATIFETTGGGTIGHSRTINAPGEPWYDANGDGVYDGGEPHVELCYPGMGCYPPGPPNVEAFDPPIIDTGGTRDTQGPDITLDNTVLHGIMYLTGKFAPQGNANYYGALVAHKVDVGATVNMWYNERIGIEAWPPPDSPVPKVYVSSWETDNF